MNLIRDAIEANRRENTPNSNVLSAATTAYQQALITKSQYFAVINALDETTTVRTTATTQPSWNREYLAANKFLNQYRSSASDRR